MNQYRNQYRLVACSTPALLESEVNSLIRIGWFPIGGVAYDGTHLIQALILTFADAT